MVLCQNKKTSPRKAFIQHFKCRIEFIRLDVKVTFNLGTFYVNLRMFLISYIQLIDILSPSVLLTVSGKCSHLFLLEKKQD